MRIVSIYPNFSNRGGAQNVCLQLASKLNSDERGVILTNSNPSDIPQDYLNDEAIKFEAFSISNVRKYMSHDTVFLSHHRKTTTMLMLMKLLWGKRLNVVHVAHTTSESLRRWTFFPKYVVAVSHGVKQNLEAYFSVSKESIVVIHNGLQDTTLSRVSLDSPEINILFIGKIYPIKQQVEFVRRTKGNLNQRIRIDFAGSGEDEVRLIEEIGEDVHYRYIGQINVHDCLPQYDYVCLYSQKEGLPLSLIEGCMYGKPLITNDILSVLDVNTDGYNGFVFPSWDALIDGLNHLPKRDTDEYKRLSRNARLHYEERFMEAVMIEKYKNYLELVIASKK